MNQKQIGISLIILGIVLSGVLYMSNAKESAVIDKIVEEMGTCFLEDGTCLHSDRDMTLYIIGWIISGIIIIGGIYLSLIDKTNKVLMEHQVMVSSALKESKKKDEFGAYIAGFSSDEQNVLKAINEQEGIQQSTLRYKVGMSKTQLSLMLKSMEEKEIISRKADGKTNKLFLRKKF